MNDVPHGSPNPATPARRISVLGATGSIGVATMDVLAQLNRVDADHRWQAESMSGHKNIDELLRLAGDASPTPQTLIVSCPESAARARDRLSGSSLRCRLDVGPDALIRAAEAPETDTVVAAIVGRAGLESTLAAVRAGKRVGLANKETLVVAGPVVTAAAAASGAELLPIDSEHSAIFQCLAECRGSVARESQPVNPSVPSDPPTGVSSGQRPSSFQERCPGVRRIILTASGGPFRDWTADAMRDATIDQALTHPTWQMGRKITIDSASMMNKALEVIEARWLFDVPADRIEVVVHPQSLIHSMVEFDDGSLIAQISPPDMKLPIQYALTFPRRLPCGSPPLDRTRPWEMTLIPADLERFPALALGFEVARVGGTAGAVVNGANETAVALFLRGQIRFTDIATLCRRALHDHHHESAPSLQTLVNLDQWSRTHAAELANQLAKP